MGFSSPIPGPLANRTRVSKGGKARAGDSSYAAPLVKPGHVHTEYRQL